MRQYRDLTKPSSSRKFAPVEAARVFADKGQFKTAFAALFVLALPSIIAAIVAAVLVLGR